MQLPRATRLVLKISGVKHWLRRAVDQTGIVLDVLVQRRRDKQAAKRLLLMGHVDANDTTGRANLLRRQKTVETGAAAEIDDSLARLHGGNRLRVAAAEPEIGAVRNRRQLRLGIAHPARFIVRSGGAFRAAA